MNTIGCPVCSRPLSITAIKGRKSKKPFIMLKCDQDGRHFRGFITDQEYVKRVLNSTIKETGSGTGRIQRESL